MDGSRLEEYQSVLSQRIYADLCTATGILQGESHPRAKIYNRFLRYSCVRSPCVRYSFIKNTLSLKAPCRLIIHKHLIECSFSISQSGIYLL